MTTVAVLADPPADGVVLPELVESVLAPASAARLYRAMLADVCRAVQQTGADLLVNYRPADQVADVDDSEAHLREALSDLLDSPEDVRYEVQVGETWAGRVGNTVTHLLEREGVDTVGVVRPAAAFLSREELGTAGMKLRSNGVVLGPDTAGGVYFAGFDEPIDFEDAYAAPALATLTDRGLDAGLDVDFMPTLPTLETPAGLATALTHLRARRRAGRKIPPGTAAVVEDLGLRVVPADDGGLSVAASDNS